jgi:hypothetical protein
MEKNTRGGGRKYGRGGLAWEEVKTYSIQLNLPKGARDHGHGPEKHANNMGAMHYPGVFGSSLEPVGGSYCFSCTAYPPVAFGGGRRKKSLPLQPLPLLSSFLARCLPPTLP